MEDADDLHEDLLESLHLLHGLGLLNFLPLFFDFFLEDLHLVLVLLDEVLDFVLVEVL